MRFASLCKVTPHARPVFSSPPVPERPYLCDVPFSHRLGPLPYFWDPAGPELCPRLSLHAGSLSHLLFCFPFCQRPRTVLVGHHFGFSIGGRHWRHHRAVLLKPALHPGRTEPAPLYLCA